MSTRRAALVAMSLIALGAAASGARQQSVVRERRRVVVGADTEEWRLEWTSPPHEVCPPEDESAFTRPCSGFTYGEAGHLILVRRHGGQVERLPLDRFFAETPDNLAVLKRWPDSLSDLDALVGPNATTPDSNFSRRVRARHVVTVMHFGDYDRDGRATEFVLQVEPYSRGSVLVGISLANPTLHVFGSALQPNSPLMLGPTQWEELLRSHDGHVVTLNLGCGDHGSEETEDVELRTSPEGIHATRYTYACDEDGNRGALKSKEEF